MLAAGFAAAFLMFGQQSVAAVCTAAPVTYTLTPASNSSCGSGNLKYSTTLSAFGKTWTLANKTDGPDGDGAVTFTNAPVPFESPTTWSISGFAGYVLIGLKQASTYAIFELPLGTTSGTWSTQGPGGSRNDLSHASVWHDGTVSPVPLPAAGWLLLAGLGGLGALARRRKAA